MKSSSKFLFGVFIAIILLVRISGLNLNIYTDETVFALEGKDGFKDFSKIVPEHPPIPIFLYSLYGSFFGNSNVAFRLVPFTFSALSLIMVYLLAKNLYDKRIAIASVSLMAISFWHTLASLQVDIDGALLTFMILCTFFFYIKYVQTNTSKWLLFTGIFFGLAILTKLPGVLIIPIIFLYDILSKKSIKGSIFTISIVAFLGILIFFLVFGFTYFLKINFIGTIFHHGGVATKLRLSLFPLLYILIWGTPLLVFTALLSISKFKKRDIFLYIWIIIPIIFYLFVGIPNLSPYDRYFMVLIPPLSILSGKYVAENFSKRFLMLFMLSLAISFIIILIMNISTSYLSHNLSGYLSNIISLSWRFYFPITGSSGPMFGMDFGSLAIIFIISGILAFLSFVSRYKNYFFHIFLGIVISLNLFMAQELIFNTVHPNFNKVISDVGGYFLNNKMPVPIYTNQLSYLYYLNLESEFNKARQTDDFFWFTYNSDDDRIVQLENMIQTKKGTILIVDYPIIDKSSRLWRIINQCKNVKTFYSKGFPIGYVFACN